MYWISAVLLISLVAYSASHGHHDGVSSYPTAKHGPVGYHGPLAKPLVLKDGHISDTHEVAAARSAHFAAVAKAPHGHDGGYGGHDGGYGGGYGVADGHGHYSYGPGTHDVYKGEHGYAGLHSVHHGQEHGHGTAGHDGGFGGAGFGAAEGHGHYSYGPGTHDVYKGEHGYAGLHSVHHGQEHGHGTAGHDGGFGGAGFGAAEGHGHVSYGPGTHDVYKGEHGYAGLHSVHHGQEHGYGAAGQDSGFGGAGIGTAEGHGHLSYGPGTHDVYKGEHGYAGLHSVHHGQGHGYHH